MRFSHKLSTMLTATLILLLSSGAFAQLPVIVQGVVLNPDLSTPDSLDILYTAFMTNDSSDKQVDTTRKDGGWAIEVLFGFAGGEKAWSPGDTLRVKFKNIKVGSPFNGATSRLQYVTNGAAIQYADTTSLPVELTEFAVRSEQTATGNLVRLSWTTVTETNSHGFEVQRSHDGNNFEKIGFIAGAGTTSTPRTYEFVDKDLSVGIYYYRLKQIDTDGSVQITDAQSVEIQAPRTYALGQNFPNPFNPKTEIIYQLKERGKVSLIVYNILGREVATLVNEVQEAGIHRTTFTAGNLPSGLFFYRLHVNDFEQVRKMAVLK